MVENEQVVVQVTDISPMLEGADSASVWIPVTDIISATPIVLRSRVWEIPAGQEQEFVMRTLSIFVSEGIAAGGERVHLAREMPGTTALMFVIHVPLQDATDYLWNFGNACRYCRPNILPWQPPRPITATVELDAATRPNAAHYASQVPLWLTTRRFWSVFHWEDGRLLHTVQFSMADKLYRTLLRRFRMQVV